MIPPASWKAPGFTLLEVLMAMLFFVLGTLALYRLQVCVIQTNTYADRLSRATMTAEAKMESLLALDYDSLASAAAPQTAGPFSVTWVVTPDQPIADTKSVEVTVSWQDSRNKTHRLAMESIRGN